MPPIRSTSFSLNAADMERLNYIQRHTGSPKSTLIRGLIRAAAAGINIPGCPVVPPMDAAVKELDTMGLTDVTGD